MDRLRALHESGVSIWLDTLSRELLNNGDFARLVRDRWVSGATTNPTIFAAAITKSDSYDDQLRDLVARGERDPRQLFFALAIEDVRRAADVLRPLYDSTNGADGFISLECTPDLADDTDGTIKQAMRLWERIDRPNVMIKVPGTLAAIEAVRFLTELGINVNVTLLFSVDRYAQVLEAYRGGLHARLAGGERLDQTHSVASFFVSRIDTKVDAMLADGSPLRGRIGRANATAAYALHLEEISSPGWQRLVAAGAHVQRPLWASTGTKNATYSDVLYVESLIAPGVVNTMPLASLEAFADHGQVNPEPLDWRSGAMTLVSAALEGVDQRQMSSELEREGLATFSASFKQILDCLEERVARLSSTSGQPDAVRR